MKFVAVDVIDEKDTPFWTTKDIKIVFGIAQSTANKYMSEFFEFAHEKHIYPMDCAFKFFNKNVVNKFAFFHYYQYRNNIKNNRFFEDYNEKFVQKIKKQMQKGV